MLFLRYIKYIWIVFRSDNDIDNGTDKEICMKAKKLTKETIGEIGMYERSFPTFDIGDGIAVSLRIKEGDKERLQVFEGDVIAKHNKGASSTFTVRKISAQGISVERILPVYSPLIESIKIVKKGDVRRAKLYYVRDRVGKAARLKEKIVKSSDKKHASVQTEKQS